MEKPQFSAMVEEKRAFFISMGVLIFLACMYGILGSTRWAVDPIQSATNFCEGISDGLVKEPMNTLSNLTYVFVGLFILWNMPPSKANTANPMLGRGMYPILFATGSMYIGVGSFRHAWYEHRLGHGDGLDGHAVLHLLPGVLQLSAPVPVDRTAFLPRCSSPCLPSQPCSTPTQRATTSC
jgi:hypothetical protein